MVVGFEDLSAWAKICQVARLQRVEDDRKFEERNNFFCYCRWTHTLPMNMKYQGYLPGMSTASW